MTTHADELARARIAARVRHDHPDMPLSVEVSIWAGLMGEEEARQACSRARPVRVHLRVVRGGRP